MHVEYSRRRFLFGAAGAGFGLNLAPAAARCVYNNGAALVRRSQPLLEGAHFTYPHANGFIDAERCVLARQNRAEVEYWRCDLREGALTRIGALTGARLYYAIGANGEMVAPTANGLAAMDLNSGHSRTVCEWDGWKALADGDINPEGTKALVNRYRANDDKASEIVSIDLRSGACTPVFQADFPLDHAHFSPFDPSWICFADGSPHSRRRTWVWHAQKASRGRVIFDQIAEDGRPLDVGHERAMFNTLAVVTIAYPDSAGAPRGLYEVGFDGAARAVSESNADSHCNVSHDGRWAVVSTLSAAKIAANLLDLCARTPSNWIRSDTDYVTVDVMAVDMKSGERRFLYRAGNAVNAKGSVQPFEPQPSISPDGRWVLVKDGRLKRVVALEIDQTALRAFLSG